MIKYLQKKAIIFCLKKVRNANVAILLTFTITNWLTDIEINLYHYPVLALVIPIFSETVLQMKEIEHLGINGMI